MKAAVYHSFGGEISVVDVEIPPCPRDGVIILVKASGVCRSDWHGWKGHDGDVVEHGLPFVPGHEVSGLVVEVGPDTHVIHIGDRVAVPFILSCGSCRACHSNRSTVCHEQRQPGFTQWGSFAEYLPLPRADRNLRTIPENVSYIQAAALGCRFTTAYRAVLQQGRLQPNESVAVFGCGGLGLSCVLMAVSRGASTIVAIDISPKALEKARELGATHTVLARKDSQDVRKRVIAITDGGAELSLDAAGFPDCSENAVWCTRRAGRMVQVGLPIGGRDPIIPMGWVAGREVEIIGSHGFAADDLPDLLGMVSNGALDPSKLIERCVSLEEGARTLQAMDRESPLGMTVITEFSDCNSSRL